MAEEIRKILVVDDEPDLENLVRQRMRRDIRAGRYEFTFAGNGVEALEKLKADPTLEMVLSDINMPQMDGLTLLDQIPQVDPNVRAVIVSAYGDMKNIRTAMNRGAFDFITKPIDFDDMKVTIDRTLRHLDLMRDALRSRDQLVAVRREIGVAHDIQKSILPTVFPSKPGYQIFADMVPARGVGGDFYDIVQLDSGRIGLAIADVSDKGVPASLFMMASRTLLKGAAIGTGAPGKVLEEVNDLLEQENDASMFVTVFYSIFDPKSGLLSYANGGHNPPLLVHADGSSELLPQTGGMALGVMPELPYKEDSVHLTPGDVVVFYTDGVTEAENEESEAFEVERLQAIFENPPANAKEATAAVFEAVNDFAGSADQFDDITCLVLHYVGPSA